MLAESQISRQKCPQFKKPDIETYVDPLSSIGTSTNHSLPQISTGTSKMLPNAISPQEEGTSPTWSISTSQTQKLIIQLRMLALYKESASHWHCKPYSHLILHHY